MIMHDPGRSLAETIFKVIRLPRRHDGNEQSRIVTQRHNALALQLWRVTHPHVYSIPVLFNDPPTNCPALVMPFFPNGNIIKYLLAFPEEAFDLNSTRRLLITEMSDALSFLHEHGIIHGNVRGSNILVTVTGHALLVDTGINAAVTDTSEYIPLPKNANWMAPELFIWDEADEAAAETTNPRTAKSDVFSFGRTIEEIYTLRDPFSYVGARNRMQFIIKLRSHILAKPLRPVGMPPEMWSVMKSCLAVISDDRPSSWSLYQLLLVL